MMIKIILLVLLAAGFLFNGRVFAKTSSSKRPMIERVETVRLKKIKKKKHKAKKNGTRKSHKKSQK